MNTLSYEILNISWLTQKTPGNKSIGGYVNVLLNHHVTNSFKFY